MDKIAVDASLFSLPGTQTILGTHFEGRVNFMALDWLTRVNFDPPMLGICVNRKNASYEAISATGQFSVNIPTVDMMEITDLTGLVSGRKMEKGDLFPVSYGRLKAAPLIEPCPVNLECSVVETVELPTNGFFIGEIVGLYTEEKYLSEGHPDVKKIRPFLLTMPDNRFWAVGKTIGKAWSAGGALLRERRARETP